MPILRRAHTSQIPPTLALRTSPLQPLAPPLFATELEFIRKLDYWQIDGHTKTVVCSCPRFTLMEEF